MLLRTKSTLKYYNSPMKSYRIRVFGIIQGVGFRPFVYNLAHSLGLRGSVCNTSVCVEIMLYELSITRYRRFLSLLKSKAPKHSKITHIESTTIATPAVCEDFEILTQKCVSQSTYPLALEVPLDMAMCEMCYADMRSNGRFANYAFCACTQCGARYSMLYTLPYERHNSAMRAFRFCKLWYMDNY